MTKHHEAMLSVVIPEKEVNRKCRPEITSTAKTLDYSKTGLKEQGYILRRTALYYRMISANVRRIDAKRQFQC